MNFPSRPGARGILAASAVALTAALSLSALAPASAAQHRSDRMSGAVDASLTQPGAVKPRIAASLDGSFSVQIVSPSWSTDAGYNSDGDDEYASPDWNAGDTLTVVPTPWADPSWTYHWYAFDPEQLESDDDLVEVPGTAGSTKITVPDSVAWAGLAVIAVDEDGYAADVDSRSEVYPGVVRSKLAATVSGKVAVGNTISVTPSVKAGSAKPSQPVGTCAAVSTGVGLSFTPGAKKLNLVGADAGKQRSLDLCQKPEITTNLLGWTVLSRLYEFTTFKTAKVAVGTLPSGKSVVKLGTAASPKSVKVGQKLTASSTAKTAPAQKTTYQWLRNGTAIKGATKSTYTAVAGDNGKSLSVRIQRSATGYTTVKQDSAKVAVKPATSKAGKVSVTGAAAKGKTVRAKTSAWASGSKLSYQWLRNGKIIKGATKSSYKLASADKSKKVSVKVTAKKSGWTTVSKTSAAVRVR